MMMKITNYKFEKMEWDSVYFGIEVYKLSIYERLTDEDIKTLKQLIAIPVLTYIMDYSLDKTNEEFLRNVVSSSEVDINIQLFKDINCIESRVYSAKTGNNIELEPYYKKLLEFRYSRFFTDSKLVDLGSKNIYSSWVKNSFYKNDKYFAYYKYSDLGFALYSYLDKTCIIELIAVSEDYKGSGVGTDILKAIESDACNKNMKQIKVGTQLANLSAINLYIKNGFRIKEFYKIYHFWNI